MNSGVSTNIGIFFLKIVARFPFWMIYFLSDIFYFIVYYIVGYRKEVVLQNLSNSFPEKSEKEIKQISKKYFHHFSDLTLETVKMSGMNEKDYNKRVVIKNQEILNQYFDKNRSVIVLTMHYNNWEWNNCIALHTKHNMLGIYKPLHNLKFNTFLNNSRKKTGTEMVQDSQVFRRVINADKMNEMIFIWLAADQTPPPSSKFWTVFLNQETPFFSGPEKIAERSNHPVFFLFMRKVKRGMYEIEFLPLIENPKKVEPKEVLLAYIRKMEEIIREEPAYYLWSHRRWKHTRPEGTQLTM